MSKTSPETPNQSELTGCVTIVASQYNSRYTDAMVEHASKTLTELAPLLKQVVVRVPGAYEIPLTVAAALISEPLPDAVIALGVIIRGSTAHADLIAQSITQSLLTTSITQLTPVIHEVLLVDNEEQAEARTLGDELNRGREAAEAAISMIQVINSLLGEQDYDDEEEEDGYDN